MIELSKKQREKSEAVMDAAEALFASYGYHAVSVRDITGLAKVRLATVNDLFGSKEKLFYEVIRRRASEVNEMREEGLSAIDTTASRDAQVKAIIAAFYDPLLEKSGESDGWRNYLRLVSQMITSRSPILLSVIEFFNPISQKFLMAIHQLYPEIDFARMLRHWQFILTTYYSVFADNFRVNSLSQGKVQSSAFEENYREATSFIHLGLQALLGPTQINKP